MCHWCGMGQNLFNAFWDSCLSGQTIFEACYAELGYYCFDPRRCPIFSAAELQARAQEGVWWSVVVTKGDPLLVWITKLSCAKIGTIAHFVEGEHANVFCLLTQSFPVARFVNVLAQATLQILSKQKRHSLSISQMKRQLGRFKMLDVMNCEYLTDCKDMLIFPSESNSHRQASSWSIAISDNPFIWNPWHLKGSLPSFATCLLPDVLTTCFRGKWDGQRSSQGAGIFWRFAASQLCCKSWKVVVRLLPPEITEDELVVRASMLMAKC